jgi:tetratricopeptide (TPR) repeat protein
MTAWVRIRVVVILVVGSVLASARPARAATPAAEREARHAFQAAEAHFRAGQFAEALAEYQAGYAAAPLPGFLINIAQCQRRLGDLLKARASYQKFVVVAPDSPLVPEVKSLIAELDKLIADLGEGDSPSDQASAPEDEAESSPPAVPAIAAPSSAPAVVMVGAAPAPAPRTGSHRRWWLWSLIGAAVVGGTVAAFALSSPGTTTIHDGSLGTLRR